VLFDRDDESHIPEPLKGHTYYVLDSEAAYHSLYDAILNQGGVKPGDVGPRKQKPLRTGRPSSFDQESPRPTVAKNHSPAQMIWREKIDFLLVEEAVTVDPEMKFRVKHLIQEAKEKLRSLGVER
jgi:hypothetical protein